MVALNEIIDIIYNCIDEINAQNDTNIFKNLNSRLFGKESNLDSLGIVTLIIAIEQAINDKYYVEITIADEKAMSQERSPFRTVDTLANYIIELLLDGEKHD